MACTKPKDHDLETRPAYRETVDAEYKFCKVLTMTENETENFEQWLRSGWLNVTRVADLLDFELTHS